MYSLLQRLQFRDDAMNSMGKYEKEVEIVCRRGEEAQIDAPIYEYLSQDKWLQ